MSNKKSLQLKALKRNSPAGGDDGACDEFINLRLEKGAFRPIGPKEVIYPKPDYQDAYIHRQDDFENWIGYDGAGLSHYNPVDTAVIQSLGALSGELYNIRSVKNFLVATTSGGLDVWLFSDGVYKEVDVKGLEGNFDVELSRTNVSEPDWTEYSAPIWEGAAEANDGEVAMQSLLGLYYQALNEFSKDEKLVGGVSYRVALRLFDGSYILHTVPRFYQAYLYDMLFELEFVANVPLGTRIRFGAAGVAGKARFDTTGVDFDGIKGLVSSIDIFFSQNQQFYDLSEDTVNKEFAEWLNQKAIVEGKTLHNARDYFGIGSDFKGLADQPAWYKVGSIDLGGLDPNGDFMEGDIEMDLKDFYQNYATRRALPVDGFSHHEETGKASYVYNNRLALGNTTQFLADPDVLSITEPKSRFGLRDGIRPLVFDIDVQQYVEYTYDTAYVGKVAVTLNTENGEKTVVQDLVLGVYELPGDDFRAVFLQGITGYFDARASRMKVYISLDGGANYINIADVNLVKSDFGNFSYLPESSFTTDVEAVPDYPTEEPKRYDANFDGWMITFNVTAPVDPNIPVDDNVAKNNNGRQVSDAGNPVFFDPLNYQDVSTGTIIAFGSNTDPISDSQFGSYPLYNFTSVGIWASIIGSGEIYITNDVPVNGEVILSQESKVDLSIGTVYATLEGLKILSGRKPVEISTPVDGPVEVAFTSNSQLQEFLNLPQTLDVQSIVDQVPFNTYLQGALIGFSKGIDDEEIYVANPAYDYVYMFDLNTKLWTKVSVKVELFINYYPKLYAYGADNTLDISSEVDGLSPVYFHTKPLAIDSYEQFKKMRRSFLRGFINTAAGKYAAFYLFGSDDLNNWTFITGNDMNSGSFKDVWCTHSHNAKRYYVFVFACEMDYAPNKISWINGIELEMDVKWNAKLR